MDPTIIQNLLDQVTIPEDGTISRSVHQDDSIKVVLFGFAAGQELSEHTASMPAMIQIILGTAHVTLGGQALTAGPNSWIHMPANLPHSIRAETQVVMLLTLLKCAKMRR